MAATNAVRKTGAELGIVPPYGAHMRLTGSVPLNDEEFGTERVIALARAPRSLAQGIRTRIREE